jgi:thioredoxin-like negative regulator of GroEL
MFVFAENLMQDSTPEVLFFLFFAKSQDSHGVEMVVRRALKQYERSYYLAVMDVEKFPVVADRYEIAATPTIVMDDLVSGVRSSCVGVHDVKQVLEFLKAKMSS